MEGRNGYMKEERKGYRKGYRKGCKEEKAIRIKGL